MTFKPGDRVKLSELGLDTFSRRSKGVDAKDRRATIQSVYANGEKVRLRWDTHRRMESWWREFLERAYD